MFCAFGARWRFFSSKSRFPDGLGRTMLMDIANSCGFFRSVEMAGDEGIYALHREECIVLSTGSYFTIYQESWLLATFFTYVCCRCLFNIEYTTL